jgi:hypothetical protein
MRTPEINNSLVKTLSSERLSKYLEKSNNNIDVALKLYEENLRLSEAFYSPLQCAEVCLRNSIHEAISTIYDHDWLTNGKVPFDETEIGKIEAAKKEAGTNIGDLIVELKFAFWVSLLGRRYDETLWKTALHKAFKNGKPKRRSDVHGRFNAIRRFRNRVMHHEPIFHRPLQQLHDEIIEGIDWMCVNTAFWAAHQSRFDKVASTSGNAPLLP